ncbi:MAG: hypothetical protein R6V12_15650 [Candidatus Hydrogenedentota bacterium]
MVDKLNRMKRRYDHILSRGTQATMRYREWRRHIGVMKKAMLRTRKTKCPTVAKLLRKVPADKIAKPVVVLIFFYDFSTDGFHIAVENSVRDAAWPFVDMAEQAGREVGDFVDEAKRAGDLHRRRFEEITEGIANDPCNAPIPMRPR